MYWMLRHGRRQGCHRLWALSVALLLLSTLNVDAAVDLGLSRSVSATYVAGETLDIEVTFTLSTDEAPTVLGLEETLPPGWSFVSVVGGDVPSLDPEPGRTGVLDTFAWIPAPDFPVTFTYRVRADVASQGDRVLSGQAVLRIRETGEHRSSIASTTLVWAGVGPFHSADTNANDSIGLTELLRVIQLYNAGTYRCAAATEDGYAPGMNGPQDCPTHDSDYQPADWALSLREVLRAVQIHNSPGITFCPDGDTEDSYCLNAG